MSLSPDFAPCTSSPKGITDDVPVSASPPTTLNNFCNFDVGEQSDSVSELDIGITLEVEPHNLHESQEVKELCDEVIEPTILDFDDDIFYAEYKSFSCGFDVTKGVDVDFHIEYESFSLIPSFLTFYLN